MPPLSEFFHCFCPNFPIDFARIAHWFCPNFPLLFPEIRAKAILATRDMQFGQEVALVMQTTHAQRMRSADSIPIVSTSICFLPLKLYTGITKIWKFGVISRIDILFSKFTS